MGGRVEPAKSGSTDSIEAPTASGSQLRAVEGTASSIPLDAHLGALSTLAAGIACQINDPLTSVLVTLEHAARRMRASQAAAEHAAADEATLGSLAHAIDEARRMREAVRALMTFARGATDERTALDPKSVLESAIQLASHELRARAKLVVDLEPVPHVDANAARLAVAFESVLLNAAQASDGGATEIRVTARTDQATALFEIIDDGGGMTKETLAHAFDPYFTTKRFGASRGLGLSVAHGIVASLGGEITIESEAGSGTCVRIRLPAARGWSARRRVLVVEEDRAVASSIARALEADDDVTLAFDLNGALERLVRGEEYDAVVCDLGLPRQGAIELYAEMVRGAPEAIRRVVFLNDGALTPRLRALVQGAAAPCIDKPIDAKALRAAIAYAARR